MKYKKNISLLIIIIILLIILNFQYDSKINNNFESNINDSNNINNINNEILQEIKTTKDGTKYLIHPDRIISGGVPKGGIGIDIGIPALDKKNIKFTTVENANNWIQDDELILLINYQGIKKAYPLQILVWHEIANDEINNTPIIITYCPLCGSGIAYKRTIQLNNKTITTKFGTSGKLYNSNLIMYDTQTNTYWQQIGGQAIIGELTGQKLIPLDIDTITWKELKTFHPETLILDKDTNFNRNYGNDPYGSYYESDFLYFDVENQQENQRIHPKTLVYGIELNNTFKAYKKSDLENITTIIDKINHTKIQITKTENQIITFKNLETNETIIKELNMFFAWYAFHPKTLIWNN